MIASPAVVGADAFDRTVLVIGLLLVLGALSAGRARRSFLSLTALFVLTGFALGRGGAGFLAFDPRSAFVSDLAQVALIVILFRDGLEVEGEMLQREWRLPLRKLVVAMPVTAALVALAARTLTDLSWTQALLLGALLAPTDPVLSSGVVTNPRVPRLIRHSLNLESGLNDGLALPAVLVLAAALRPGGHFSWLSFLVRDLGVGFAAGVLIGLLAARVLPRQPGPDDSTPAQARTLYAVGTAFACYGITVFGPGGNGLIAVFVCAITLGVRRPELRAQFAAQAQSLVEVAKLMIFVVFGSLLTIDGLTHDGWAVLGIVAFTLLVARSMAVWVALLGTGIDRARTAFMAWFGPKGVATMTFSLVILASGVPGARRLFDLAAATVFASILVHGLTDTAGVGWIERRAAGAPAPPASR